MRIVILAISLLISSAIFAQKADTTIYVLKGHIEDFAFMRSALQHPENVTPKSDSLVVRWIETIKPEEEKKK